MGFVTRALILILITIICLTSVAYAITGQATFYLAPYVPSSCYGYGGRGIMILAANRGMFADRGACGRRYRVRCTGGTNPGGPNPCRRKTIVVTVVDLCPGCVDDQIDLSQEAFAMIADPDAGRIKIEYYEI